MRRIQYVHTALIQFCVNVILCLQQKNHTLQISLRAFCSVCAQKKNSLTEIVRNVRKINRGGNPLQYRQEIDVVFTESTAGPTNTVTILKSFLKSFLCASLRKLVFF